MFGIKVEKDKLSLQVCWSSPVVLSITPVTGKLHIAKGYIVVTAETKCG